MDFRFAVAAAFSPRLRWYLAQAEAAHVMRHEPPVPFGHVLRLEDVPGRAG